MNAKTKFQTFKNFFIPIGTGFLTLYPIISGKIPQWIGRYPRWSGLLSKIELLFLLVVIGIILISIIDSIWIKPSLKQMSYLKEKVARFSMQISNTLKGYLVNIALSKLPQFTAKERINIYLYDVKKKIFRLEARHCLNPEHNKQHKKEYPLKQGCIYEGWKNGFHFDNSFPASKKGTKYIDYVNNTYNIDNNTCQKISKKSRLFAVLRIDNNHGKNLGVLLIESENNHYAAEDELKTIMHNEKEFLFEMLYNLKISTTSSVVDSFEGGK